MLFQFIKKHGDKSNCNNYRPISLLSSFNKIFEKKIQSDLVTFIERNNILYEKQFGFRKYHSTIDALINLHDYIIDKLNSKNKVIGVFIDLKKAFDSIDINILIEKLKYYGIVGPYNTLLESYLKDRNICTIVNNNKSNPKNIKYGVPQGSVIGPLLFSLYINDLKTIADDIEINLFADDTSLLVDGKNSHDVLEKTNIALNKLSKWLLSNSLTLNTDKTHYLDFSTKKIQDPHLTINDQPIIKQNETKYLGLIIQDDLKWNKHINRLINKLNSQIPLYLTLRDVIPKGKLKIAYNSLAFSLINYGIELYGRKNNKWLNQLQKTQNRLLKLLYKKSKLHNTNSLHKNTETLKITDHCKLRLLLIGHRVLHNKQSINCTHNNLILTENQHNRNHTIKIL